VADLDIPSEIIGAEIIREDDGLAMSSRNRYLLAEERAVAPFLYQTLLQTSADIKTIGAEAAIAKGVSALVAKNFAVEYLEIFENRLLVAAKLGNTRLIDNVEI
jgi:pantoate--beta-alanine ligase